MNNLTENFTSQANSISVSIFVYSFNMLLGLPMHFFVIWLIVTGKGGAVASQFFNLNLSVCEIGTCINCVLFLLMDVNFFRFISVWVPATFLVGLGLTGRPLFQTMISVERYLAVVHPVTFLKFKPLRYKVMCSVAVWMITLGFCGVFMQTFAISLTYSWLVLVQLLFYISIQLYLCFTVLRVLKQSGPGEKGLEKEEENHVKRRAFYLILIITINMFVTYLPFVISALFTIVKNLFIDLLWSWAFFIFTLAGFLQPVLYLQRYWKCTCFCSL